MNNLDYLINKFYIKYCDDDFAIDCISYSYLNDNVSQQTKIECLKNLEVLKELAKGYKDSYITAHLLAEYNCIVLVRMMTLSSKERIKNNICNMLMGL